MGLLWHNYWSLGQTPGRSSSCWRMHHLLAAKRHKSSKVFNFNQNKSDKRQKILNTMSIQSSTNFCDHALAMTLNGSCFWVQVKVRKIRPALKLFIVIQPLQPSVKNKTRCSKSNLHKSPQKILYSHICMESIKSHEHDFRWEQVLRTASLIVIKDFHTVLQTCRVRPYKGR